MIQQQTHSEKNESHNGFVHRKFILSNVKSVFIVSCIILVSCADGKKKETPQVAVNPLFKNSIVSTDIDFIKTNDPDAFIDLAYIGLEDKEMPDSRNNILFDTDTFVFEASFSNNKIVGIWAHSSFGSKVLAQEYADKVTHRLGKLPNFMRDVLSHVVIHKGDAGAFAESEGHFFVLYSDNIDTRISNNDLEETIFHESVHAALDATYLTDETWNEAKESDNAFITIYGKENAKEDLAESAIFAYTMIMYPGRLSSDMEEWVNENTANRLEFFRTIFE